jgi:sialate O-acetylesterase
MLQYGESLPMWCGRLRKQWGNDDFHLLAVMLPRYGRVHASGPSKGTAAPDAHSWAWFREAQLRLLDLPHTGVANTIDLGDIKNIHPKDKAPIGKRLALLAARDVNGLDIVAEGPTFAKATVEGKTIRIELAHARGLKTTDGKAPSEFWIAGKDRKWHRAEARIDGEAVILQSPAVPAPAVARYAFAAFPKPNLLNAANLPAVPFRTDEDKP